MRRWILILAMLFCLAVPVFAEGGQPQLWNGYDVSDIDLYFSAVSVQLIAIGAVIIGLLTAYALACEKKLKKKQKKWIFVGMAIPSLIISLFIVGSTIFVNVISVTSGPVHWHADFEVYKCGQKYDLLDPTGLSNRVGTAKFHEHDDLRVHVEGTVVRITEVSIGAFFNVIGGHLDTESFSLPLEDGVLEANPGETCNGDPAELQVFLYEIINPDPTKKSGFVYRQRKLEDGPAHIMAPFFNVPPGDCVIIEYSPSKERTEHICETYRIGIEQGDLHGS